MFRIILIHSRCNVLDNILSRMGKPFNPLLGETYQLEQEHFRIACEQVKKTTTNSSGGAKGDHYACFHLAKITCKQSLSS